MGAGDFDFLPAGDVYQFLPGTARFVCGRGAAPVACGFFGAVCVASNFYLASRAVCVRAGGGAGVVGATDEFGFYVCALFAHFGAVLLCGASGPFGRGHERVQICVCIGGVYLANAKRVCTVCALTEV